MHDRPEHPAQEAEPEASITAAEGLGVCARCRALQAELEVERALNEEFQQVRRELEARLDEARQLHAQLGEAHRQIMSRFR